MEAMAAHPTTQPYKGKAFAFDPRMVSQYRRIAEAVHAHGSLILAQPWHRGRQTNSVTNGIPVWAPSAIPCAVYRETPHVMTREDIAEIVEGYRLSARFAREGGLDGIEVHGMAHGYLLNQFLSPATNHREDEYGGSLENRLRIVMQILDATRAETGPDFVVGVRINSDDGMEGGLGPEDWAEIARRLEATGHLDYISCSQGTYLNRMMIYPTSPEAHGYQVPATRVVKRAVGLPVVAVGRIVMPEEAEGFLAGGDCDPMWGMKAEQGRSEDIRPCVGANWCMESIFAQAPIACIHNPAAGAEAELGEGTLRPAKAAKRVAVVGAGPAGMQAAASAARRGHEVVLFEQCEELGGQVAWWSRATVRKELRAILTHLERLLRLAKVEIRLGHSPGEAELAGFDSVIVATGSTPLRHGWTPLRPDRWAGAPLPGADLPHVYTLADVLGAPQPLVEGERVVIYDSIGGRQAMVAADHLAELGRKSARPQPRRQPRLGQGVRPIAADGRAVPHRPRVGGRRRRRGHRARPLHQGAFHRAG
jgi:2,4-dienoyl-CoA reductase-like NADH-dependent reductase (Old Yellow Enzyme family)